VYEKARGREGVEGGGGGGGCAYYVTELEARFVRFGGFCGRSG
jgi:hypothetical protein